MVSNTFAAKYSRMPEGSSLAPFMEELSAKESVILLSLAGKVFSCPRRYGFSSGDEAAEAFIRYKKRLRSIIRKSGDIHDNKDAYMDSCLRFLAKSVQRSFRRKELSDFVLESAGEGSNCVAAQTDCSLESRPSMAGDSERFISSISPSYFLARMGAEEKRLLYLVIKCAWEMDDVMAEKAAARIGVPILWLCALLHQASASLEPSRLCLARMNERGNAMWVRLRLIEAELRGDNVRPERREKLLESAGRCRKRYKALLERKGRYRILVSNRAIAELLRIPKGSVDSGLFYLKANLRGKLEEP